MKNETTVEIKISSDLLAKLQHVADVEGRSLNNQFLMMARNAVAYYEKVHGRIKERG